MVVENQVSYSGWVGGQKSSQGILVWKGKPSTRLINYSRFKCAFYINDLSYLFTRIFNSLKSLSGNSVSLKSISLLKLDIKRIVTGLTSLLLIIQILIGVIGWVACRIFHLMVEALSSISWMLWGFLRSSWKCLSLYLKTGASDSLGVKKIG